MNRQYLITLRARCSTVTSETLHNRLLSHVTAFGCHEAAESPGMKESIFSHVQVRGPLKVLGLGLVHRLHSISKLSLQKVF